MFKWTSVLAFAVACFVGVNAYGADAPPKKEKPKFNVEDIFKRMAGDDGKLTLEELKKSRMGERLGDKAGAEFEKMDTAAPKGEVNLDEFKAYWEKMRTERKPGDRKPGDRKPGGRRGGGEKPKT